MEKIYTRFIVCVISVVTLGCVRTEYDDPVGKFGTGRITTRYVKDIFYNEVTGQAELNDPSGIIEQGFLVSERPQTDPSNAVVYVADSLQGGRVFSTYIGNLTKSTDYYLRAYAMTQTGEYFYGEEIRFTTPAKQIEYVTMGVPVANSGDLTAKTVNVYGCVSNMGGDGQSVVEYGAYYWPKDDPDQKIKVSHVVGDDEKVLTDEEFLVGLTGMHPDTEYTVQVYARNVRKEQYAPLFTVRTKTVLAPEIVTTAPVVYEVTATTAKADFTLLSTGNDPETEYGVYYGTQLPLTGKIETKGIGTDGVFMVFVRGLSTETTYYVQGYARNDHSEVRGDVSLAFTTLEAGKPMLTSVAVEDADILLTTATLHGMLPSDGGSALTAYGVRYGTDQTSLTQTQSGGAIDEYTGAFSVGIEGLQPNTQYYYVLFAANAKGETVTDILEFKTGIEGELQWIFDGSSITGGTKRMIYFELPAIDVTIVGLQDGSSRAAKLHFLDRNLGATRRYKSWLEVVDGNTWYEMVGYYYKWGNRKPDLVYMIQGSYMDGAMYASSLTGVNGVQKYGWRNNTASAPTTAQAWPANDDPCPAGYHVPTLEEWQAFSRAAAANGTNNGDFTDVFNLLALGKTGYRQQPGQPGNEVIFEGRTDAHNFLGYVWSSTPCHIRPYETVTVSRINVPETPLTVTFDNAGSTAAYHFGVTTDKWIIPQVGNPYILSSVLLDADTSNDVQAYTTANHYDPWMYYGINTRDMRAGMPVRCVRTVYE